MAVTRTIDHVVGTGSTISTGTLDLLTYTPPNSTVGGLFVTAAGKSAAATPLLCKRVILASWKKSNAGTLTIVDIQVPQQTTDLALLTTNLTVLAVSGAIIARATGGLLGTDLEWGGDMWISIT